MHTLVTLSSPHLGYTSAESKIVRMAMWVFKNIGKSTCLNQLTLSDSTDPGKTALYSLSQTPGMGWFRTVVLVSSR